MVDQTENKNLLWRSCPHCAGSGQVANKSGDSDKCSQCQGIGLIGFVAGNFFYWGKRIDNVSILQTRLHKSVQLVINAMLILFGLAGLILGFFEFIRFMQEFSFTWQTFWNDFLGEISGPKFIFLISLLTDLYAYYRMDRQTEQKKQLPKPTEQALKLVPPDVPFEKIRSKYKLIDGSDYYHERAIDLLQDVWLLAQKRRESEVLPLHLLATLIEDENMKVILTRLGISADTYISKVKSAFSQQTIAKGGQPVFSPEFKKIFIHAYLEAFLAGKNQVDVPQLFISLCKIEGIAREVLLDMSVDYQKAKNVVAWINVQEELRDRWNKWKSKAVFKPKKHMNRAMTARPTPLLDSLGRDLTIAARSGALFPLIDRKREMESVIRVMQRGKGNVLLVGDPGVGKGAIVRGLAQLMASEEVPEVLQDKRLVEMSTASLVAGGKKSGNVEGRMHSVVDEIIAAGNIILFVDDLSNLVGAGGGGVEESVDVSDVLISAISRGLVKVIGSVGRGEYSGYLANNDVITRNFSKVEVEEPDTDTGIVILEAHAGSLEYRYKVFFTYEAIDRAVRLSQRYVHDQYLPAKSIALLEEAAIYVSESRGKNSLVSGEDVAKIVSEKTSVKVTEITEDESVKLMNLEERIHQRIVNQSEAVDLVASALRRARAELRDEKRPIVNLLFLGPTGVGKTELAKTVSEIYFGGEEKMVRVDMSEYQSKDSINRLIGYPPGFRGATAGGYLTDAVRKSPFSLVLLDEFEKAHPDILNLFLQVMDDGRLTDGAGRTIDFTNSIIIATSNAGTQQIQEGLNKGESIEVIKEYLMSDVLKTYFRPELLNRFDSLVVFKPLSFDHIIEIAHLLLKKVQKRLTKKGITLEVTPEAVNELAEAGFDPTMGARPLRRVIQEKVDNSLADYLLTGRLGQRDVAVLDKGGKITVQKAKTF